MASHYLLAHDGGRVRGALSLFEIRHPLFGHYLTTAVFGTDGGLHFDDAGVRDALIAAARTLGTARGVSHISLRTRGTPLHGFVADTRFSSAVLDLDGTPEDAWNRLPGKTRNQVRRGMKEGFAVSRGHDELVAFHRVFHQHMRALGSPAHGMRFYEAIIRHLGPLADFFVVRDGTRVVAGALLFRVNGTAMNYHTVSLHEFNVRCPNYLLYWRMIERAYAERCRSFDMARSEAGSTQMQFKQNWGPREVPLAYNYLLIRGREVPRLDPRNPRFRVAIAAWKRTPLALTRTLGPWLISGLA
jgi:FemAB-related protein (PEP-CTERM system-associated)